MKPFDLDELLARLWALIRRGDGRADSILKSGGIEMEGRSYNAALASKGPNEIAVTRYLGVRSLGETMIWRKRALAASQRCEGSARRGTG